MFRDKLEIFPGSLLYFVLRRNGFQSHLELVSGGFASRAFSMHLPQSNKGQSILNYVLPYHNSKQSGNINPVSIDYAFRPRLRSD